jgi:hypothetical protein
MENQQGLIFIPDISGFTKFVNETEIEHSQHIIRELIEIIINTNTLRLQLSEIEGDAVLFFRKGSAPSLSEISDQVRQMFIKFHEYLQITERDRVCHCGACSTTGSLTLKFLVHFGEMVISEIKGYKKLIGRSVILAHRLLKNDIPANEYILLTEEYLSTQDGSSTADVLDWDTVQDGSSSYEHIGEVFYQYIVLTRVRDLLPPITPVPKPVAYPDPVQVETKINAPPDLVYKVLIDLGERLNWSDGLREIEYEKKSIPRIGVRHLCFFPSGKVELETVYSEREENKIYYAERANNNILFPEATNFITITQHNHGALFSISFHYRRRRLIGYIIDMALRKKMAVGLSRSAINLKNYVERIKHIDQTSG